MPPPLPNSHCMPQYTSYHYLIADHYFRLDFAQGTGGIELIPQFRPFAFEPEAQRLPLCTLTVDDGVAPIEKSHRRLIRRFDTGNGDVACYHLDDGGYQFVIYNIQQLPCCLLITNKDFTRCRCALNGPAAMRAYGLVSALMMVYAFAASHHDTLLIHASLVRQDGYGYAFIARSGTGKSTQVSSWLRYLPGCDLMNDDNPVVRIIDGEAWIYGSPWSGKTPCYRNVKARLGAITRIDRQPYNRCDAEPPTHAFASLLPSCSSIKWDVDIHHRLCQTVARIIELVPIYLLHCLPDRQAAEVCHAAISRTRNTTT